MLMPLEYHFPDNAVSAKNLDKLLSNGYFRTGNYLMRTKVLYFNEEILNTLHVRILLDTHQNSKSLHKILKRNSQKFTYTIQPFSITIEKEHLYKKHKARFKGNASTSLSAFMYDNYNKNIFNTYEINVYDGETLVAFSFFDVGINSMASIIGIFNQAYEKYSLGIYTMLLEMEYAKSMQYKYYYPGYVAYEPSQFNYKLRLSDLFEYYDWYKQTWRPFEYSLKTTKVSDFFIQKMQIAKNWLNRFGLKYKELFYPYFYMGGMYAASDCVKGVHHLLIEDFDIEGIYYIIEFHPEKMELLLAGITIHKYQFEEEIDFTDVFNDKQWKRVLLYLHPTVVITNEFEMYAGFIFLQELFRQHLLPPPITNTNFKNPNINR